MIRYFIVLMFCFLYYPSSLAQNPRLDSLTRKFKDPSLDDTTKFWVLYSIAEELSSPGGNNIFNQHKLDSAILVLNQALLLSIKKNFTKGIGWSYNSLGQVYRDKGLRNQALDYFLKGLQFGEKSGDQFMVAAFHNEIGNIYLSLQRELNSDKTFQQALYHYRQSIKIVLASNDNDAISFISTPTSNIGNVFFVHKDYDSAIFYYHRAIEVGKNTKEWDNLNVWRRIDLINVYEEQSDWNKALQLGRQALGLATAGEWTKSKDKGHLLEDIYSALAAIHLELNNYDSAYYFISKSMELQEPGNNRPTSILSYYYFKKGDYSKAIQIGLKNIDWAKGNQPLAVGYGYKFLSDSYAKQGNYKKALDYHRLSSDLADSLSKINMAAKVLGQQADYDAAKQIDAISLLEKDAEIKNLAIQRNTIIQYLTAGVLLLALVIIGIVANQYRLIRRSKREQEQVFKEVDTLKSRFFANISHEFRTPLTLILAPLEKRLSLAGDSADKTELTLMHRNASRLLVLVNQLLDLSRVEAGQLKLNCRFSDLNPAIQSIASQFSSMADSKGIQFQVRASEPVALFFDPEKLDKIVSNLLSNAFKFTPASGSITLVLNQQLPNEKFKNGFAQIMVTDTGIGIAPEHLPKIFDRFYQADTSSTRAYEGTGIGLALTRELVELHHGAIQVASTPGQGSCFTVQLPLGNAHLKEGEIEYAPSTANQTVSLRQGIPEAEEHENEPAEISMSKVLVVEDNSDLRYYLRINLSDRYAIYEASDGEEGLAIAFKEVPDLVISDLMMPKIDGIQLCHQLKKDERTSHIPVILLTAKVDQNTKIEGLETGADDYIAKPFNMTELNARINGIIDNRKKLQEKYVVQLKLRPQEIKVASVDDRFLKKVLEIIELHIGDSSFSVDVLSTEAALSSAQLYRKLKALTNHTPNDLIRDMRLARAASLFHQHAGNVAEVAYQVGFNNLSYFAKCFKEKYSATPSEFAKLA